MFTLSRASLRLSAAVCLFASFASATVASAQTAVAVETGQWTQVFPAASPAARMAFGMAFDSATGKSVIFGGAQPGYAGFADTWTYDGSTWVQTTPSPSPAATFRNAMAFQPSTGKVVDFGNVFSSTAATWVGDGSSWQQLSPSATPSGRSGQAMAYDASLGKVVLFGGGSNSDTWTWDGTTWAQLFPTQSPAARDLPSMAYDTGRGVLVLFGGSDTNGHSLSDTWTFNGTTWTQSSATGPGPRNGAVMAYDPASGNTILFGGINDSNVALNDTWLWNGSSWTQLSGTGPSARAFSSAVYDSVRQNIVLFGGGPNNQLVNDTWTYTSTPNVAATTNVGSAASTQLAVTFNILTTGTLGVTQVLTLGAPNLDFTLGTGSTCTGASTGACVVNVAFTPTAPGIRVGAVNLTNSSGVVIATALISGMGNGPLATTGPGNISTIAGSSATCDTPTSGCGDNGPATSGQFSQPLGMAVDAVGNVYVADAGTATVRKITASTGVITTVAGNGTQCASSTTPCGNGTKATTAALITPYSVALDGAGNLYFTDAGNNVVRKVTASTGILSTVAGTGTACSTSGTTGCGDGLAATAAQLHAPTGVFVDAAGNLYIADVDDYLIRKVTASTGLISSVAGNGKRCTAAPYNCGNGTLATSTTAELDLPYGVVVDAVGNLYIADNYGFQVRKVTAATGLISTFAGTGVQCTNATLTNGTACGDGGAATSAKMSQPTGLALDAAGNLYVTDYAENRVRKISAATGLISTVAGNGADDCSPGDACGDGTPAANGTASLSSLAIAADSAGNLYIGDDNLARIRKISNAGSFTFATATAAGTADTTDGTQLVTLNNIGNQSLTLTAQTSPVADFVLGNPMTGGCSTSTAVAVAGSCLIGVTFAPQSSSSGLINGNIKTTTNMLGAAGNVLHTLAVGATSATATNIAVNQVVTTAGTASVVMGFQYGYAGVPDAGAQTIMVNGSATGVGATSCVFKASHANCSFNYTGPALSSAGSFTISVAIGASSPYTAFAGSNYLYVNPAVSQGGGHSGAPVTGFATPPVRSTPVVPSTSIVVSRSVVAAPVVYATPSFAPGIDATTSGCTAEDAKIAKASDSSACPK